MMCGFWLRALQGPVHFASSTLAAKMLRVWKLTGEELVSVSPEELSLLSTARTLKSHLSRLYGFPETLQQLLYDGCLLKDADRLPTPADLQLVLQSALHTDAESDELFYAIHHGYTEAVRLLLAAGAFNQLATWQRNKVSPLLNGQDFMSGRFSVSSSFLQSYHCARPKDSKPYTVWDHVRLWWRQPTTMSTLTVLRSCARCSAMRILTMLTSAAERPGVDVANVCCLACGADCHTA